MRLLTSDGKLAAVVENGILSIHQGPAGGTWLLDKLVEPDGGQQTGIVIEYE